MQRRGAWEHRHGWLCGTPGVVPSVGLQQTFRGGMWGGDGFVLQKLSGPCQAFVELGGECVTYDLPAGQSILVHPGHVGMFQDTVGFDITMMRGIRNALFGGDGLFIARLTGPGKVWLQSMTVPNLAHAIAPYLGGEQASSNTSNVAAAAVAGNFLNGIFGKN